MRVQKILKGTRFIRSYILNDLAVKYKIFFPKPLQVYWNITDQCNFRCKMCDRWRKPIDKKSEVTDRLMKKVIDDLADWGIYKFGITGGEPFLRKNKALEVAHYAASKGLWVHIGTNASLVNEELINELDRVGLGHLSISIDGPREMHDSIRNFKGSFDRILKVLELSKNAEFDIKINTVLSADTLDGIFKVIEIARTYSCPIFIQPYNPYNSEILAMHSQKEISKRDSQWIPEDENAKLKYVVNNLIKLKKHEPTLLLNNLWHLKQMLNYFYKPFSQYYRCTTGYRNIHIAPNGDIVPCWYFSKSVGNIKEKSIKEIWYSDSFDKIRKSMDKCKILCLSGCRFYPSPMQLIIVGVKKSIER